MENARLGPATGPYASTGPSKNNGENLIDTFETNEVALVVSGHEHHYLRNEAGRYYV